MKFDITITSSGLRSQALLDLLAQFSFGEYEPLHKDLPCQEISFVEIGEWCLVFNGSSTYRGGGVGVVLYTPGGTDMLTFKLEILCSNTEPEYEAPS